MLQLQNKSIELGKLITELRECAKRMDNESHEFNNTTNLIQQYTLEKIIVDDALKVWNQK